MEVFKRMCIQKQISQSRIELFGFPIQVFSKKLGHFNLFNAALIQWKATGNITSIRAQEHAQGVIIRDVYFECIQSWRENEIEWTQHSLPGRNDCGRNVCKELCKRKYQRQAYTYLYSESSLYEGTGKYLSSLKLFKGNERRNRKNSTLHRNWSTQDTLVDTEYTLPGYSIT